MKNRYTKEIAAAAVMALFAPWANAQVDVYNLNNAGANATPNVLLVDGNAAVVVGDGETFTVVNPAGSNPFTPTPSTDGTLGSAIGAPGADTAIVTTRSSTFGGEVVTSGGAYAQVDNTGSLLLSSAGAVTDDVQVVVVVENEIYQPGNLGGFPAGSIKTSTVKGGYFVDPGTGATIDPSRIDANANTYTATQEELDAGATGAIDFTELGGAYSIDAGDGSPAAVTAANVSLAGVITAAGVDSPDFNDLRLTTNAPRSGGNGIVQGNLALGYVDAGVDGIEGTADDTYVVPDVEAAITSNSAAVASNNTGIVSNKGLIDSNNTGIVSNKGLIDSNNTGIVSNKGLIDSNNTGIVSNKGLIDSNNTGIVSNKGLIDSNNTGIVSNKGLIDSNNTGIVSNKGLIDSNNTGIVSNKGLIDSNNTGIVSNKGLIDSNNTGIVSNKVLIDSNNTGIVSNKVLIDSNDTNIASNNTKINNEIQDRSDLIRRDTTDGTVHIGDDSFILDDTVEDHVLTTDSGSKIVLGGDIASTPLVDESKDIEVAKDLTVNGYTTLAEGGESNGTFYVRPAESESSSVNVESASGTIPDIADQGDGSSIVSSQVSAVTGTTVQQTSGGVELDVDGNATLSTKETTTQNYKYGVYSQFDVDNATNTPTSATTYVAGYEDETGFHTIDGAVIDTNGETDPLLWTVDLSGVSEEDLAKLEDGDALTEIDPDSGHLVVGGNTNIAGDLTVGGTTTLGGDLFLDGLVDSDGYDIDVVSAINGNSAAIASNTSAIEGNSRQIKKNKDDIETNARGIAMVAALQHTTVLPGMTNAFDFGASHFEGETGMSLNYARRINENWQINFGAASTTDFDESVVKAGVGVQW